MLKVVVPLAGRSDLFIKSGYPYPKPLIEINGKPMIQWVIDQVKSLNTPYQLVFIVKEEDARCFHIDNTLRLIDNNCAIIKLKGNTKGALCSVLMSIDIINDDDSILILNGDQIIDVNFSEIHDFWQEMKSDVGIVTFQSVHPRWSYALLDNNKVIQTAEKNPISNHAIAGYYYFQNSRLFFDCAFQTILNDVQKDGLYYISSVINEFILCNKVVHYYVVSRERYHSFYSPKLITDFKLK